MPDTATCPSCAATWRPAAAFALNPDPAGSEPAPGDLVVCGCCASPLILDACGVHHLATAQQLADLDPTTRCWVLTARAAAAFRQGATEARA